MREFERQFEPEEHLTAGLHSLVGEWKKQDIDPDAFIKCSKCKEYFLDEKFQPRKCSCD